MWALILISLFTHARAATCIDYDKPQDIQSTHFWDGKTHLVPMAQFKAILVERCEKLTLN